MKRSKTLATKQISPDDRPWNHGPARASESEPFALIDDFDDPESAWLHRGLVETIETRDPDAVRYALAGIGKMESAAGFIAYEAGFSLEPRLAALAVPPPAEAPPLLWFGHFSQVERVAPEAWLPSPEGGWAGAPQPMIDEADHARAIGAIRDHLEAGDAYQVNFTFPAGVSTAGHPAALYAGLRRRASAGRGALLFTGAHWILSLSPELFFELREGRIATRPMKGTAPPGSDPEALRGDPKQRAENLMIVDLIRNDLSRIAVPGSVKVPVLFAVEPYPSLLQMTSTVTATLSEGVGIPELIQAIFPCGSITGAPKIRTMELIAGLEAGPRGIYCGALGRLAPGGEAAFNVAIRTLVLPAQGGRGRIGLGSGIVYASHAGEEWRECLLKGRFVADPRRFDLIETMAFDPRQGVVRLDLHLERMRRSAEALDFAFDRHEARNELQAATFRAGPSQVRLRLSRTGAMAIELRMIPPAPAEPVTVGLDALAVDPGDFRIAHKTSDRRFYDEPREASGYFEILFRDGDGFLTEGSFTSLFVPRGERLLTPPVARGLLPGVLRQSLIEEGRAEEGDLREEDLADGFYIGNSLRGLIPARLS